MLFFLILVWVNTVSIIAKIIKQSQNKRKIIYQIEKNKQSWQLDKLW